MKRHKPEITEHPHNLYDARMREQAELAARKVRDVPGMPVIIAAALGYVILGAVVLGAILVPLFLILGSAGCEPIGSATTQHPKTDGTEETATTAAVAGDEINPALVVWFGSPKCGGAAQVPGARISSLRVSAGGMTYKWAQGGCEALGASGSGDYSHTIACAGYLKGDGKWYFGKFDWVSTSRTSRSWENIYDGYNGWKPAEFFDAKKRAFVIVSSDGKRRTNFITD